MFDADPTQAMDGVHFKLTHLDQDSKTSLDLSRSTSTSGFLQKSKPLMKG